jgi:membrane fusion protein, multidrug efflux system
VGLVAYGAVPSVLENELESMKGLFPRPLLFALSVWFILTASHSKAQESERAGLGFEARGMLIPSQHAKLASRTKGVIAGIRREGDTVNKGDPVLELESEVEGLQLQQQNHILELRAFEREASDELASKSVISKTEVEEKRVNYEVARVQLELAGHLLEMRKVLAPFDGVVAERLRERGEAVDEFTPVITLVNLELLYLEVFLPAARIREVKKGQAVVVTVPDLPGRKFAGEVSEVSPSANPASGEFKVRVLVPNRQGELVAGTPAVASFGGGA